MATMQMPVDYRPQQAMAPPMHANGPSLSTGFAYDGKFYSLRVEQQPDRARMCGFGDKDRRPITPPPCIRLVVTDVNTGQEVDYTQLEGEYVLSVDIWDQDATCAANEVKHSSSSASVSISMATVTSFPPPPEPSPAHHFVQHVPGMSHPGPYGHPQYLPPMQGAPPQQAPGHSPQGYPPPPQQQQQPPQQQQQQQQRQWPQQYLPPPPQQGPPPGGPVPANGQFQRNLIGSSHVSSSQLTDLDDNFGYWFVLQDLSVRTEGIFRLKLSFMDIRLPNGQINNEKVPILATTFTEPFQVYSAKKFPGVKESTELSRCFANQGVKIPIRKDTGGAGGAGSRGGRRDDDDDD